MFLRILTSDFLFVAQTQDTSIEVLIDFVETDFFFASPLTLTSGSYLVESNYTVTGDDDRSFWSANLTDDFEMRIGDPAPIPEPSTLLLLGAGLLGLAGYGRRRSRK